MSAIADIIKQQVASAAGGIQIPSAVKNQVLGGLSDSILGSLTQTAAKAGGVDAIKNLVTGKVSAASSPITDLAGKLFANNVLKSLNLDAALSKSLSGLVPVVMSGASKFIKDKDGDGDVDLNDIILTLTGSGAGAGLGKTIAKGILGSLLRKK